LKENLGIAFMGDTKGGPFEIQPRPRRCSRRPTPMAARMPKCCDLGSTAWT
jgi:hypothetical protein